ncbi:Uncharacterised protein [Vibrio cholerae]|nr:Uncharacterised protein [Vibrio cholerae]CSB61343.1 Uncharacterised protein [Vibrio cholerae]CSC77487.1 Uncharacterised protein [Vibrio cholerae]
MYADQICQWCCPATFQIDGVVMASIFFHHEILKKAQWRRAIERITRQTG